MPLFAIGEFYAHENVSGVTAAVTAAAERILESHDRLAYAKHRGLSALDEYTEIHILLNDAAFLLGIEYGRRLAADERRAPAVTPTAAAPRQDLEQRIAVLRRVRPRAVEVLDELADYLLAHHREDDSSSEEP